MKAYLFKVKKGKLQQWKDWCSLLVTKYNKEALESMREELVLQEACLVGKFADNEYVLGLMEGGGNPTNMESKVNKLHRKNRKECLEKVGSFETALYTFKVQL